MSQIKLKSPAEIEIMRQAGVKLGKVRQQLLDAAEPGKTGQQIESLAQRLIKQSGCQPSFSLVPNYNWATCININQGVVHGVPNNYVFKKGDIVSIDVGLVHHGFHSDCSASIICGYPDMDQCPDKEKVRFLTVGKKTLALAIDQARVGQRIGHISQTIEANLIQAGYQAVPHLTGHGIGRNLHEAPHIPGVLNRDIEQTAQIKAGLTVAVEVIYVQGQAETRVSPDDGWTVEVKDGKITATFEETIAIVDDGPLILTKA